MKTITLTQGKVAVVDDLDYACLILFKWHAVKVTVKNSIRWYAARAVRLASGVSKIYMHVEILGQKGVDHADHDGLNNQRSNLRAATQAQNNQNRRKYPSSSQFKGVRWRERRGKWESYITIDGHQKFLGLFTEEVDAAEAYNKAAKAFGNFAHPNYT